VDPNRTGMSQEEWESISEDERLARNVWATAKKELNVARRAWKRKSNSVTYRAYQEARQWEIDCGNTVGLIQFEH